MPRTKDDRFWNDLLPAAGYVSGVMTTVLPITTYALLVGYDFRVTAAVCTGSSVAAALVGAYGLCYASRRNPSRGSKPGSQHTP